MRFAVQIRRDGGKDIDNAGRSIWSSQKRVLLQTTESMRKADMGISNFPTCMIIQVPVVGFL